MTKGFDSYAFANCRRVGEQNITRLVSRTLWKTVLKTVETTAPVDATRSFTRQMRSSRTRS
jgi:hypothetical protein